MSETSFYLTASLASFSSLETRPSTRFFPALIATKNEKAATNSPSVFLDYFSSGEVTRTAMRHCLVLAGVRLTSLELAAVDQSFRSTTRPEMIGWKEICRAAVEVCNGGGLGRIGGSGREGLHAAVDDCLAAWEGVNQARSPTGREVIIEVLEERKNVANVCPNTQRTMLLHTVDRKSVHGTSACPPVSHYLITFLQISVVYVQPVKSIYQLLLVFLLEALARGGRTGKLRQDSV